MDKILSGLSRFGLDENLIKNIFEEESSSRSSKGGGEQAKKEADLPVETDFLLLKTFTCPVCDNVFKSPVIKASSAKRKEPDLDLRPRFEHIDTNKYDVASCPKCGFTSVNRYFVNMPSVQVKLIKEGVLMKLKNMPSKQMDELEALSYDTAIDLYKIALYTAVVKRGKNSEKAYTCLKIAWLLRGKVEELSVDAEKNKEEIARCNAEYAVFYKQALDGFMKAMSSESYPLAGMDESTVDLLIAAMSYNVGKYEVASRYVSSLIVSRKAGTNIKNRAHDLKDLIVEKLKNNNNK